MHKITVIDSLMGQGKTTWAAQYMDNHPEKKFLYITPYISEDETMINERLTNREVIENFSDYFTFMHDMICRKQIVYKEKIFYGFLCPEIFSAFKRIYLLNSKNSATDYEYWNLPIEEKITRNCLDHLENGRLFVLENGL